MQQPGQDDLKELLKDSGAPAVSIYLPTHRAGGGRPAENRVRLKRLVGVVCQRLDEDYPHHKPAQKLHGDLKGLVEQEWLWNHEGTGIAIFASPQLQRTYWLDRPAVEIASVGRDFYITPLLERLDSLQFYVLALSRQMARMFNGSRRRLEPAKVKLPNGLAEITQHKETERSTQFRQSGTAAGAYHGQGEDSRRPYNDEVLYIQAVDAAICRAADQKLPLVLAAAEPLGGLYHKYSRYPKLQDKAIDGNPASLTLAQLHQEAIKLLDQRADPAARAAAALFAQLASSDPERVSTDPAEISLAARDGRVKAILNLAGGGNQGESHVFREHLGADSLFTTVYEDLADQAIRQTLLMGGQVHVLPPEDFPAAASLAAIFRY